MALSHTHVYICTMRTSDRCSAEAGYIYIICISDLMTYMHHAHFRSDALRRHGYEVIDLAYEDDWATAASLGADFALVAKAPSLAWV